MKNKARKKRFKRKKIQESVCNFNLKLHIYLKKFYNLTEGSQLALSFCWDFHTLLGRFTKNGRVGINFLLWN